MSTQPRITEEMLLDAGLQLLRAEGEAAINVRRIAAQLGCSTQPVLYRFRSVGALKEALYRAADAFHTAYLMEPDSEAKHPLLSIGLRYVRFGAEERHLFRFLFQSGHFGGMTLQTLLHDPQLAPILSVLVQEAALTQTQAEAVFSALVMAVHGAASFYANNAMPFDPAGTSRMLRLVFFGTIGAVRQEGAQDEETV